MHLVTLPAHLRRIAAWLILGCLFSACAGQPRPLSGPASDELPPDVPQLLTIAEEAYRFSGGEANIALSFAAAEKAVRLEPGNLQANLSAARAAYWLFEFGGEALDRKSLAETGERRALQVVAADPQNAAGHFFAAAHLGYRLQMAAIPKISEMEEMQKRFARALELDRNYDQGAPLRALGTLLVRAPAWPTGVGDLDGGIAYLVEAARLFPEHPANHLYLAEAYYEAGRSEEARCALARCRELLAAGDWGAPGLKWRSVCEKTAEKLH